MPSSTENKKIVIAGGSGFLGVSLAHYLVERGYTVAILSRSAAAASGPWRQRSWDGRTIGAWREELNEATGLVNLAGRSVSCIKTPDHQDEILRSRVESTLVLGEALRSIDSPPPVWVQMSTAHIYGDPPKAVCSESSAFGYGLAPTVGRAWEDAFRASILPTQRGVILRTSFVLGRNRGAGGGALDTLSMLARVGLGGKVGNGSQGMSWIHEVDMNRLFERGLTDATMLGAYIASAPHPVSQVEFMRELRRAVRMPIGLPAASWMVRIAARLLLRTDPELALYGRYVISRRLEEEGFKFHRPQLCEALQELLRREAR
jgi:uncharacterized protein (TIGR01777 family)